jgi:PIN domain nuclease of toxin-antitoxin system
MSFLLDTHVLLWLTSRPQQIPDAVRRDLADMSNQVFASAASAMEIATKVRSGKMPADYRQLTEAWPSRCTEMGLSELPITSAHTIHAGSMDWEHRDPFDRLLVAQSVLDSAVLVTVDAAIRQLPGIRIRTW